MERRSVVAAIVLLFCLLYFIEITLADTGQLSVHVTDSGQPVSDAVVTATCVDPGCDSIYTFDSMGEGVYLHEAMRAPQNYRILAEKGTKSATTQLFVLPGPNPDVYLSLMEASEKPWEASTAEASTVYGFEVADRSNLLNNMAFMLIPLVAVVALRIWRRKR